MEEEYARGKRELARLRAPGLRRPGQTASGRRSRACAANRSLPAEAAGPMVENGER